MLYFGYDFHRKNTVYYTVNTGFWTNKECSLLVPTVMLSHNAGKILGRMGWGWGVKTSLK